MGILSGKDIFSSKYITAQITDAFNRRYFIPIKHTIGDYFLAVIENDLYCFKIVASRITVYQHTLVRSFRMIDYNLSNYLPISGADINEFELVLRKNNLPKMNMMMFNILKILGRREKTDFKSHDLVNLANSVSDQVDSNEYQRQIQDIKNYLTHLDVQSIVTPVRKLSEFIEGDLLEPDPHFFGTIVTQIAKVEEKHKLITNTPEKGKVAWIKIILILSIMVGIIVMIWWIVDSGVLNSLFKMPSFNMGQGGFGGFSSPGGAATPEQSMMSKYPTPESMQAAIDRGELSEDALTPDMKDMLKNYKAPEPVAP